MCRTEHPLDAELRQKLSMFCSVAPEAVIEFRDVAQYLRSAADNARGRNGRAHL